MRVRDERLGQLAEGDMRIMPTLEEVREMARELLVRRTGWVMLTDIASPSGKQLWACVCCGHVTPAPSKTHQCQLQPMENGNGR